MKAERAVTDFIPLSVDSTDVESYRLYFPAFCASVQDRKIVTDSIFLAAHATDTLMQDRPPPT
jgi:hypothetical protein